MLKQTLKAIGRPLWKRLKFRIDHQIDQQLAARQPAINNLSVQPPDFRKIANTSEQTTDELWHIVQSLSDQIEELRQFAQSLPDHFENEKRGNSPAKNFRTIRGNTGSFGVLHDSLDVQHARYAASSICRYSSQD